MEQQLIEETIEITPATMNEVLAKLTTLLNNPALPEKVMNNLVKSLFYGLWNFDKMINQHNLSTNIAAMLTKIPKKSAFALFGALLNYLSSKWNLIDHHRINKFMQLTRYIVRQAMKISHKKTDEALLENVFKNISERSGIIDHVIQLYFDTVCEVSLNKNQNDGKYANVLPFEKLQIFQKILQMPLSLEYIRQHVMQKIYEKLKCHIIEVELQRNQQEAQAKIAQFNNHLLEVAKNIEDDSCRKSMYTLIGYMKSDHGLFSQYLQERLQRQNQQVAKKQKKLSKGKKKIIKQAKQNRKQKNKQNKRPKTLSRQNFQFKARQEMKKMID